MILQFFKSWGVLVILALVTAASNAYATVEINIAKTLKIDEVPVEVVVRYIAVHLPAVSMLQQSRRGWHVPC